MNSSTNEELTEVIPEKPKQVRIAITILYSYLIAYVMMSAFSWYQGLQTDGLSSIFNSLVCSATVIPIYLILVYRLSKGNSRARVFILIWFIYNTLLTIYIIFSFPPRNIFYFGLLIYLVGLVATIVLFVGPSKVWFEYHKQKKGGYEVTENDGTTEKEVES